MEFRSSKNFGKKKTIQFHFLTSKKTFPLHIVPRGKFNQVRCNDLPRLVAGKSKDHCQPRAPEWTKKKRDLLHCLRENHSVCFSKKKNS